MRSWKSIIVVVLVWLVVGTVSSWRLFSLEGFPAGGDGFIRQLIISLPGWILWAAATPFIYWLTSELPISGKGSGRSLVLQLFTGPLFSLVYVTFFLLMENSFGIILPKAESFAKRFIDYTQEHFFTVMLLYYGVAVLFYILRVFDNSSGKLSENYENSILIKTRYGYVLVEIERFQYVRNARKKVMFHTGRRKHLSKDRVEIDATTIVDEKKYSPDRRIVIDLGKIRRADLIGDSDYHFYIGYSHQLIFNQELFRLLGAWLPTPKHKEKADYF